MSSFSINTYMQNLPIYLYSNTLDVILDLDTTVRGINQVMYQRDLKIQKGIKNQVRIQFKNSDQKRISISPTQVFMFSMFDVATQRLVLEKQLQVLDETTTVRGLALLTITENDTIDLTRTSYQYSVKLRDTDGTFLPTYTNTYYGQAGTLFLDNDVNPVLQPSQEVVSFLKSYNASTYKYEHKSGNVYAFPEQNGNTALHTMAMYMQRFHGKVYIQATLDNTPASFGRYVTVATRTYTGFTGVDYVNFNGIFSYVRIMYVPDTAPAESTNDNANFFGSFDKVLYRC
jgi:hypothetical protein